MEHIYKRVQNIDEKVKDARLPYQEWKVLFLIGEQSDAAEISSLLSDDSSSVSDIFESLESKGLIEKVAGEGENEAADNLGDSSGTSLGDELLMEEDEKNETTEEDIEPEVHPNIEDEPAEEITESPEEEKINVNTDFLTDDLLPKDEEFLVEKSEDEAPPEEPPVVPEPDSTEADFDLSFDDDVVADLEPSQEKDSGETQQPEIEVKPEPEPASEEETISDVSKKTIMVIDDSIVIRKMIEIALEDEDFNIVTAISGKEGLEYIESQQPNLVILDMMLPDMNGIDVLRTIKSEKKLPVIMLSGKDSPQLIESAKEIGVDDFLPKPFRDEELVEKVRTLVGA